MAFPYPIFAFKPNLRSLVLVSNRARITFPKTPVPGMESVIKSEQFRNTTSKAIDDASPLAVAKFVGKDTLRSLAEEIAKLHVPIEFDWHARFGLAKPTTLPLSQRKQPDAPPETTPPATRAEKPSPAEASPAKPKQKLACHACSEPIAYNVAKFCGLNKTKTDERFHTQPPSLFFACMLSSAPRDNKFGSASR